MDPTAVTALIVIGVVAVIALIAYVVMKQRRTNQLRDRFGDEYDRTLEAHDGRGEAEANLADRERRVKELEIRPLTADERDRFASEWHDVKATFVDSPTEATLHADRLLGQMMKTKGFPMADFDRRYEDLTVDHGDVARHYRDGHELAARQERGEGSTEDMRQAMKHYEALYDELIRDAHATDNVTTIQRDENRVA